MRLSPKLPLRSLVIVNFLVALWIALTGNLSFLGHLDRLGGPSLLHNAAFMTCTVLLLTAYVGIVLQWLAWGRMARPLLTSILLASALCAFFVDTYGVGIDAGQIQNLMETDVREAADLISLRMLAYLLLGGLLPVWWLWRRPLTQPGFIVRQQHRLAATLAGLVVITGIAGTFYADYASLFRGHREVRLTINPHNYLSGLNSYFRHQATLAPQPLLPYGRDAHRVVSAGGRARPVLLVLVVGETARAESFGLNGYDRDTTPELARRQVINFSQVSACGTATAVSVPCMFSGYTRKNYDAKVASHREGLLDIIQRAGYRVTWIDNNSGCKGTCDRVGQMVAPPAIRKAWCHGRECLDELLAATLAAHLDQGIPADEVVVLHQAGSHGPAYSHRYPAAFRRYTPDCTTSALQNCSRQEIVNAYDNTIAYTDHVLAGIIDVLKAREDRYQTALLYVSDHGESTGEHGLYLHGAPYLLAPSQQTHVPMVAWLSDGFSQAMGDGRACLARQRDAELSHDNLFPTMLGLLNIRTSVRDASLDISNDCRQPRLAQQEPADMAAIR